MNRRNIKALDFVKALEKYGCKIDRKTPHGVYLTNPKNNKSTNVPTHRKEVAVWIYGNVLRQLEIDKKEFEKNYGNSL